MAQWNNGKFGNGSSADIGHGLSLRVDYSTTRLPPGEPAYIVTVFDRRLKVNSPSMEDGQARAERAAQLWLNEALSKLAYK